MKKIMNSADTFVDESLKGLVSVYSDKIKFSDHNNRAVIRRNAKEKKKVAIVTGGGYGHLPTFMGFVGKGYADACAVGNVFTSPSSDAIYDAATAVETGKGILFLFGNYTGDCLNFDMAKEMLEMDNIRAEIVTVTDDIASACEENKAKRRGIAGMFFAYKLAGAKAEEGAELEDVVSVAKKVCEKIITIGFAFSQCTIPGGLSEIAEIGNDEMEIGMGIHGEPGIIRRKKMSSREIAEDVIDRIIKEKQYHANQEVAVLINSLGGTSLEELGIFFNDVKEILEGKGIVIYKTILGRYATSMEMQGASLSILELNDEFKRLLNAEGETPFVKI